MARRLGVPYFNAGLLYRALALWCVRAGLPLDDAEGITSAAARDFPVEISLRGGTTAVALAGGDVTAELQNAAVSSRVPEVSRHPGVRAAMTARQREVVRHAVSTWGGVVIDGRDATSVVVPDADVKIVLTVSPRIRSERMGDEGTAAAAAHRDRLDSLVSGFDRGGPGVTVVDTNELDRSQTVAEVLRVIRIQRPEWPGLG